MKTDVQSCLLTVIGQQILRPYQFLMAFARWRHSSQGGNGSQTKSMRELSEKADMQKVYKFATDLITK